MAKVSVIIPIHELNKNLKRCLDSILNQTLEDIEIIIVNDNPTNIEILNSLNDSHIDVINVEAVRNLGYLRNVGIVNANSKYIGFADINDYMDPEMYKKLYTNAIRNNADIASCDMGILNHSLFSKEEVPDKDKEVIIPNVKPHFMIDMEPTCVNKIYKRDYIDNFYFDEDVIYDDYSFNLRTLGTAEKVYIIRRGFYFRNKIETSKEVDVTNLDIFKTNDRIRKYYIDNGLIAVYQYTLNNIFTISSMEACSNYLNAKIPTSDKKDLINYYIRYIELEYGSLESNKKYEERKEKDKTFSKKMKAIESFRRDDYDIDNKDEILDNIKELILKNSRTK